MDTRLRDKEMEAEDKARQAGLTVFGASGVDAEGVARALEILVDASRVEQERGTNLNARAAVVATVAGLIVSVSGGVAKSVFDSNDWTDWSKLVAIVLFVVALFAVAAAMVMAVLNVLRPKPGPHATREGRRVDGKPETYEPETKNFLGQTLVELWLRGHQDALLRADTARLDLMFIDRCLRTLPEWHLRNRLKARWSRRAWVFLAAGIVFIALAAFFVLAHAVGAIETDTRRWEEIPLWILLVTIAVSATLSWVAIEFDVVRAGGREKQQPESDELLKNEIEKLARELRRPATVRARRGRRRNR